MNTAEIAHQQFPIPRTEDEKRELLRAGSVAISRLWGALNGLRDRKVDREDCHDEVQILMDDALENASLLFEMICNYLPATMDVDTGVAKGEENPFDKAFRRIRNARRDERFSL